MELIGDGIHLDPETVRMVFELVGADNIVLVTDSMAATGLPDGDYELGRSAVAVRGGPTSSTTETVPLTAFVTKARSPSEATQTGSSPTGTSANLVNVRARRPHSEDGQTIGLPIGDEQQRAASVKRDAGGSGIVTCGPCLANRHPTGKHAGGSTADRRRPLFAPARTPRSTKPSWLRRSA